MILANWEFVYTRSDEEIRRDFLKLQEKKTSDFVQHVPWTPRSNSPVPVPLMVFRSVRAGQFLSEKMHWQHRMKTSTIWCKSGEAVKNGWKRNPELLHLAAKRIMAVDKRQLTPDMINYEAIRLNSALTTLTHFRAGVSKYFCDTCSAKTVLDFSAGWGDRLTGFLAAATVQSIDIIDPRPGSIQCCEKQYKFIYPLTKCRPILTMHQGGAECVLYLLPSVSFDLIVSSPPYFNLEEYGETDEEAVGQIRKTVSTVDGYVEQFLRPCMTQCARLLKPGGKLVINLDDNKRAGLHICKRLLEVAASVDTLSFVGTAGLRKGNGFGNGIKSQSTTKIEPIYIWTKKKSDQNTS